MYKAQDMTVCHMNHGCKYKIKCRTVVIIVIIIIVTVVTVAVIIYENRPFTGSSLGLRMTVWSPVCCLCRHNTRRHRGPRRGAHPPTRGRRRSDLHHHPRRRGAGGRDHRRDRVWDFPQPQVEQKQEKSRCVCVCVCVCVCGGGGGALNYPITM